jgi:hypothetical protein
MSNETTSPVLKWILIAIVGLTIPCAVFLVLYATYPVDESRVARELQARGFGVIYEWQDNGSIWRHPANVYGMDQSITPDDCRLICQLPHLRNLDFVRCDMSGLNLDEIGNCQKLSSFCCIDVTQFPVDEIGKLAACPVRIILLPSVHLKDGDLEAFTKLTDLDLLFLEGNIGITDAGLDHFEKIASLRHLKLSKTSVTNEGIGEFQKKRPDVRVSF